MSSAQTLAQTARAARKAPVDTRHSPTPSGQESHRAMSMTLYALDINPRPYAMKLSPTGC
jgi:hypothetical protein